MIVAAMDETYSSDGMRRFGRRVRVDGTAYIDRCSNRAPSSNGVANRSNAISCPTSSAARCARATMVHDATAAG